MHYNPRSFSGQEGNRRDWILQPKLKTSYDYTTLKSSCATARLLANPYLFGRRGRRLCHRALASREPVAYRASRGHEQDRTLGLGSYG